MPTPTSYIIYIDIHTAGPKDRGVKFAIRPAVLEKVGLFFSHFIRVFWRLTSFSHFSRVFGTRDQPQVTKLQGHRGKTHLLPKFSFGGRSSKVEDDEDSKEDWEDGYRNAR